MVKSGIKIFARIRPTKKQVGLYEVGEADDGVATVSVHVPRSEASGYVNNKKESYSFRFSRVFDQSTRQDDIFESVARGVIDNCLEGYNGTIFAYGQTGSGKTFTITGGAERYADRGIIPRTLSYLFQEYQKSPGTIYSTHISYLEIYNDSGYDLLDPKHEAAKLEDLPKVKTMEDSDGNIHLKNLSLHPATNEEEALNWLFLGDTNRMIAETPMNMASTRSHCIFTVHISSREPGSDTIRKAKLHLVDLAGSERVSKTGVGGTLLAEAKYINLSLHNLEHVIVALSEKSRTHIPYRNSMMTSVLRDSLGGNCMTTMIATCSVEKKNIEETISTCRFAQRVALVKNEAVMNEELDPKLMVARLKQQVQELKDELSLAAGEERTDDLTDEEKSKCKELLQAYLEDLSPEARLSVGSDMRKIQLCFQLLKAEIFKRSTAENSSSSGTATEGDRPTNSDEQQASSSQGVAESVGVVTSDAELQRLRELLQQRDDEINVLLKMLKQERRRAREAELALKEAGVAVDRKRPPSPILGRTSPLEVKGHVPDTMTSLVSSAKKSTRGCGSDTPSVVSSLGVSSTGGQDRGSAASPSHGVMESRSSQDWKAVRAELSQARQEAFDSFRKNYADTSGINEHKKMLKIKYSEAKALGERVNTSRVHINKLKSQIEQQRVSQSLQGLSGSAPSGPDPKEEALRKEMELEKANFKSLYGELRELKTEIEHIQHLLEKAKVQLQKDFEKWWSQQSGSALKDPSSTRSAWHTPPHSSGSVAPPPHHLTHQPRPPSSAPSPSPSLSHRSRSRSRHGSSRGSRHRAIQLAAQFSQQDQQSLSDKPVAASNAMTGDGNGGVRVGSESSTREGGGREQLLSPRQSTSSRNHSLSSSGVGSSVSSFGTTRLSQTGTTSLEQQSSSLSVREGSSVSTYSRREPESLPRVSKITTSNGSTRVSGHSSQSLANSITSNSLHHPKPLFGTGRSSSNRSHDSSSSPSIPLTGDSKADADIIAFYRARQKLIQKDKSPK